MTKVEEIYIDLLDEGIDVQRPVRAVPLGNGRYCLLKHDFDPEIETWKFAPGTLVRAEVRNGSIYAVEEIGEEDL